MMVHLGSMMGLEDFTASEGVCVAVLLSFCSACLAELGSSQIFYYAVGRSLHVAHRLLLPSTVTAASEQ